MVKLDVLVEKSAAPKHFGPKFQLFPDLKYWYIIPKIETQKVAEESIQKMNLNWNLSVELRSKLITCHFFP